MAKNRRPYVKRLTATSDGSTNYDVKDDPVPAGYKIVITHWSAKDQDNAFTALKLGVMRSGYFHELEEEKNPNADTLYWSKSEFHFTEGDVITTRFVGTTNGDNLVVFLDGYIEEVSS